MNRIRWSSGRLEEEIPAMLPSHFNFFSTKSCCALDQSVKDARHEELSYLALQLSNSAIVTKDGVEILILCTLGKKQKSAPVEDKWTSVSLPKSLYELVSRFFKWIFVKQMFRSGDNSSVYRQILFAFLEMLGHLYEGTGIKLPGTDFLSLEKKCPQILIHGLEKKSRASTSEMILQAEVWPQEIWFEFSHIISVKQSRNISQAHITVQVQSHMCSFDWWKNVVDAHGFKLHQLCSEWVDVQRANSWANKCKSSLFRQPLFLLAVGQHSLPLLSAKWVGVFQEKKAKWTSQNIHQMSRWDWCY